MIESLSELHCIPHLGFTSDTATSAWSGYSVFPIQGFHLTHLEHSLLSHFLFDTHILMLPKCCPPHQKHASLGLLAAQSPMWIGIWRKMLWKGEDEEAAMPGWHIIVQPPTVVGPLFLFQQTSLWYFLGRGLWRNGQKGILVVQMHLGQGAKTPLCSQGEKVWCWGLMERGKLNPVSSIMDSPWRTLRLLINSLLVMQESCKQSRSLSYGRLCSVLMGQDSSQSPQCQEVCHFSCRQGRRGLHHANSALSFVPLCVSLIPAVCEALAASCNFRCWLHHLFLLPDEGTVPHAFFCWYWGIGYIAASTQTFPSGHARIPGWEPPFSLQCQALPAIPRHCWSVVVSWHWTIPQTAVP